uniref:B-like cyclin n=1 Tax=Populus tomentosa TaxID=118781 RepID=A0A1I9W0I7_POPTO|nr:cyclin D1;1 [Populus tomentosa]
MSVSTDVSSTPINLYCNETPGVALCSSDDDDISETSSLSSTDFPVDFDESYIDNILLSELHQMPATELITRFLEISQVGSAHQDALNWMLKAHASYRFKPETAYLSVSYFHCFILSRPLQQGKGWPLQLLAVACLSLAAKMEETRVPSLLDIQLLEPRFYSNQAQFKGWSFWSSAVSNGDYTSLHLSLFCIISLQSFHISAPEVKILFSLIHPILSSAHVESLKSWLILHQQYQQLQCYGWLIKLLMVPNYRAFTVEWTRQEMVRGCYNLIRQSTPQRCRGEVLDAAMPGNCHAKRCCRKGLQTSAEN